MRFSFVISPFNTTMHCYKLRFHIAYFPLRKEDISYISQEKLTFIEDFSKKNKTFLCTCKLNKFLPFHLQVESPGFDLGQSQLFDFVRIDRIEWTRYSNHRWFSTRHLPKQEKKRKLKPPYSNLYISIPHN